MESKPLILVAPGVRPLRNGNKSAKEYPFWGELVQLLKKDYEVQEITEMPLYQLEALIKQCHAAIACDSFFQHFAWSCGKSVCVLWGKSDPEIFGHPEHVNLLKDRKYLRQDPFRWWEDVPCSIDCWVQPEEILKAIKENFK